MYPLEIPDHHGTLIKPLYWVRYRIRDKLDMDNIRTRLEEGWQFCRPDNYKSITFNARLKSSRRHITYRDCVLCYMDKKLFWPIECTKFSQESIRKMKSRGILVIGNLIDKNRESISLFKGKSLKDHAKYKNDLTVLKLLDYTGLSMKELCPNPIDIDTIRRLSKSRLIEWEQYAEYSRLMKIRHRRAIKRREKSTRVKNDLDIFSLDCIAPRMCGPVSPS